MAGHRDDRRRAPGWLFIHVLAIVLLAVSGADGVLVQSLTAAVDTSDTFDLTETADAVGDYCRIHRDPLAEYGANFRPHPSALDDLSDTARPPCSPFAWSVCVLTPRTEHASRLGLRTRSPG